MCSFAKKWICTLLLFILVVVVQFVSGNLVSQTGHTLGFRAAEQGYLPHGPISIMENQEFITEGWPGNGTINDPYEIENLEILCDEETGIFIANTTVFFEISNCKFVANDGNMAFWFINITNGNVKNCLSESCYWIIWNSSLCSIESTIASVYEDIILWGCINCSVLDNSLISDTWGGVIFDTCTNCTFARNAVVGSGAEGIWLIRGVNCSIQENEFAENVVGIGLLGSNDTLISYNNIHDNMYYGVEIYSCGDTQLVENTFQNNGVVMHFLDWGWNGHYVSGLDFITADFLFQDNIVNGKLLGFFQDLDGSIIDANSYGQVILLNCSDIAIDYGTIANTSIGVQILFSDNCTVKHMTITNCSFNGIVVQESNSTKVLDCIFSNNAENGLFIERSFNVQVVNSSISGSNIGLGLQSSGLCTILNNTLCLNTWGTRFYYTSNCVFVNNTVLYNKVGVYLAESCDDNVIYGNSIGWNEWRNAQSDNYGNQWDDGVGRGNRWSDYDGSGVYKINSVEVDRFPELLVGPFPYIELGLISIGVVSGALIIIALIHVIRSRRISEEL